MSSILEYLFGAASFMPHGYCLLWRPDLVAMHAVADAVTALSYFAIPVALYTFSRRRRDLEHAWVLHLFAAFILLCGTTHLIGLMTLWWPAYGAHGLVKLATGVVSAATAITLWPLIPKAVALPSPADLRLKNTELQRALAEQEKAAAEFETLFQDAPDATLMVGQDGRILRANKQASTIFGYSLSDLLDLPAQNLMPDIDGATLNTAPQDHRIGAGSEVRGLRSDGTPFVAEFNASPTSQDGKNVTCVSVRDVSEDRRLREQLAQSQRLDAIGRLTSGVSHDFNNILSTILANLQLIERCGPFAKEQIKVSLNAALKATSKGAELTRDLLRFARRAPAPVAVVNINNALRDVRQLVSTAIPSTTKLQIGEAPNDTHVLCDQSGLETSLINLVANARDATGLAPGGEIKLSASIQAFETEQDIDGQTIKPGSYIALRVDDTGTGMNPNTLAQAATPFFTTKPASSGTGLGLSLVAAFVSQHNGYLLLRSEVSKGTAATVLLPTLTPAQVAQEKADRSAEKQPPEAEQ